MANMQQVANAFTVDFVERVAKNAAALPEIYGRHAALTINDFELGTTEVAEESVTAAVQKWAATLVGSRLRVDSIHAAPLYGGVNVFITLTAFGELQQYFHVTTTLESYSSTFGVDSFYVRHQIISRIGAVVPEPVAPAQPVKEATPEPAPEPVKVATPEPAAAAAEPAAPAAEVAQAVPAAAAPEPEAAAEKEASKEEAAPTPAPATRHKSWASLMSAGPTKAAEHKPVRVVAREGGAEKSAAASPKEAAVKRQAAPPRERHPTGPVGDRLMFNIATAVTDDEVKAALGPMAEHLTSLRNNSARGLVFMDFAANVQALEEITKLHPVIGASATKIAVFRQRGRESNA